MKLIKITIAFFLLIALQISAAQWLHVPPPVAAKMNAVFVSGGVVASAGYQTPARVSGQQASYYSAAPKTVAFPGNNTAGNTIIAVSTGNSGDGVSNSCTFTDTQSNSYTTYSTSNGGALQSSMSFACIGYALNIKAGANSVTVTYGDGTSPYYDGAIMVAEYSGIATSSAVDGHEENNSSNTSSSNFDSGAGITPSQTHVLLIGAYSNNGGTNTSTYTNWTKVVEEASNTGGMYERILTSASGAYDFSGTMAASNAAWTVALAGFKAKAN